VAEVDRAQQGYARVRHVKWPHLEKTVSGTINVVSFEMADI
jgi:hypothetical protein